MRARGRHLLRPGPGRADRGRGPSRPAGRGRGHDRPPERTHAGQRHRMGARHRSALPCAGERRRGASPRVDRAPRARPRRRRARPQPARIRGMAEAREPAHRRPRIPSRRPRELQRHGRRSVRRASPPRAPGHRRDRAAGHGGRAGRPDGPGAPDRAIGRRGALQPGDRRPAVRQPADGRVPPAQGVPKARRQQPQGASRCTRGHVRTRRLGPRVAHAAAAIIGATMVDVQRSSSGFLNRLSECDALERLVAGVRGGQSRVLVLRGEAGVGKTALLRHLSAAAKGCRIARAAGVESEMELAFAGLHALCAPMLGRLDVLPRPQRDALSTAFGLSSGPPPDRFLVGLAVLGLLADAAEAQPLVCIVDDAQWLDRVSAQTLAFVARRLLAERVGLVFAVREAGDERALEGLPELAIGGLSSGEAQRLLDAAIPGPLDERVRARILSEAGGNPLALIELPRGLAPAELAGGFGLPDNRSLASRIEQAFLQRVRALPPDTQRFLLTAAAEPVGDLGLLWRAAGRLGLGDDAGRPAEDARLIELDVRVRFPHPLVRSAVYRAADPSDRRDVHRALADSTDPGLDPDRRAWHRAHATAMPDEAVAAEMARSADRAQGRGGLAAAAAFLQRAAELTPDPAVRVERSLAAAQAKLDVADAVSASDLLAIAAPGPLDELQRARLERLGAQIAFASRRGRDAPPLLLEAARRLEPLDTRMARDTYLEAMASAMYAGRLGSGPDERAVAEAARASNCVQGLGAADLLLDALVTRFTEGYAASVAPLSRALRAFGEPDGGGEDRRWLWLACRLAQDLWDDELWHLLATRGVRLGRDTGALNLLPNALNYLAAFNVHSGAFATAAEQIAEVDAIAHATGLPPLKHAAGRLAAARGDQAHLQAMLEREMPG